MNGPKQRNYLLTADHCFVGAYMPSLVFHETPSDNGMLFKRFAFLLIQLCRSC